MHVIVAGYPRAGTTLLYNMLRYSVDKFEFFDREMKAEQAREKSARKDLVSKRPTDVADAPWLTRQHSDVELILCVRDPRSVLTSVHAHAPDQYKISWDSAVKTNCKKGVVGEAPGFIERHDYVLDAMKISRPYPTIVYYENLVRNPEGEQERLSRIFDFQYSRSFLEFHQGNIPERLRLQLNGVRPPDPTNIIKWQDHPRRIYEQFTQCPRLFEILKYWGYEADNQWFREIARAA